MLEKFLIRPASIPRETNLTFLENGFYYVLKQRVRENMRNFSQVPKNDSKVINTIKKLLHFLERKLVHAKILVSEPN